jgi:NAD(P)-dependent dehydrogenase (short-subunit alcohol dehydrogenase family)
VRPDDTAALVALVPGGGSGIGRAAALELAASGARVVVCGRREEPLPRTRGGIESGGGECASGWLRLPSRSRGWRRSRTGSSSWSAPAGTPASDRWRSLDWAGSTPRCCATSPWRWLLSTRRPALDLLLSLRAAPLLRGARGRPARDLDAAAAAVAAVSRVAAAHPEIAEIEVNPLLALPDGALGLDARVVRAERAA